MKVTFRCKRGGNTISFDNVDDIAQLRKHEGYEEVIQEVPIEAQRPVEIPHQEEKKRGRPSKVK